MTDLEQLQKDIQLLKETLAKKSLNMILYNRGNSTQTRDAIIRLIEFAEKHGSDLRG